MQPQDTNTNPGPSSVRPVGAAGAAGAARPVRPVVRRPVAVGGASAALVTPAPEPVKNSGPSFDNGPSVVGKKERKTGWILAIILLLLIAAGGVGFGVWMWMDGNTQKEALNNQINSLQRQNAELQNKINESFEGDSYKNAIIVSPDSNTDYFVNYTSSPVDYGMESEKSLNISLTNGEVSICKVVTRNGSVDCSINGLSGKVHKVVELGGGHDNSKNKVAFIMEDGTVGYMPLIESLENNDFTIVGYLDVEGNVSDIFDISAGPSVNSDSAGSGYMASVIVFNNGTFAIYDESMTE